MTVSTSTSADRTARSAEPLPAFDYEPLGRVLFESGGLAKLGELARELGGTRVLLVTDPGLSAAGHPQRASRYLRQSGLEAFLFDGVEENPETSTSPTASKPPRLIKSISSSPSAVGRRWTAPRASTSYTPTAGRSPTTAVMARRPG